MINKVEKAIDLLKAKYMIRYKQKAFKGKNYQINYVLEKHSNSKDLIIAFTSCTAVGQPARYNYVRTLDKYKCNKLFILDDFGFDKRGAYYLGKDKDFNIEKDVKALIDKVIKDIHLDKKIFVGSSKGGYAAMYFGVDYKDSIIITGAPQYKLGDYLSFPGHKEILRYIMGDNNDESVDYLNKLMDVKIQNSMNNSEIFLHYSEKEENYETDLKYLVRALEESKMKINKDIEKYERHSQLTSYFPTYIRKVLDKVIG